MRFFEADDVPGKFDDGALHAQADAEEGDAVLPSVTDGLNLAVNATRSETGGNQDAVHVRQDVGGIVGVNLFAVHPVEFDLHSGGGSSVGKGFRDALVAVLELHVFADQSDVHALLRVLVLLEEIHPGAEVHRARLIHSQFVENHFIKALFLHQQWNVIDGVGVNGLNDGFDVHIAEPSEFVPDGFRELMLGPANEHIGLDTEFEQLLYAVLGGLRLELSGGGEIGNQRQVHHEGVFRLFPTHLAHRFDVGQGLDVANGASNFRDHEVVPVAFSENLDAPLDLVGDVGDDLNCLAQVFAAAFLVDDTLVDAARGDVVGLGSPDVEKALVVTEVEVGLGPVIRHEAFPMLVGIQGSRVNVDVGVEFLDGHLHATGLQKLGQRRADDALSEAGGNSSRDEDVLGGVRLSRSAVHTG